MMFEWCFGCFFNQLIVLNHIFLLCFGLHKFVLLHMFLLVLYHTQHVLSFFDFHFLIGFFTATVLHYLLI